MAVYTPVIRLPPKRNPSLVRSHSNHSSTSHSNHSTTFDPKDCLVSDTLFLSKLPQNVRETDIRTLLQHCMPTEILLDREKDIGQLRFSQPKYADRAYSLYNGFTFTNNTKLELQMYQAKGLDPEATAGLLEINGLPEHFDDNKLYDVFRPFGPLNLCKCVMKDGAFRGTAFIQFFSPYSSDEAEASLDGHSLDEQTLSVVPFMPSKTHAVQQQYQPKDETIEETNAVDIMNLYIKNLEPHITNQDLNQTFRKFGRIISARVMTNPATGQSKGYGFVSFGKSEEAAAALQEMNGVMLGSRPLIVAYHEPRKGRPNTMMPNHHHNQNNNHRNGGGIDTNHNNHHYHHPHDYNNNHYQQQQQQQQPHQHQQQQQPHPPYYISDHTQQQQHQSRSMNMPSTPVSGLGIDNVDELGMNMNLKDLSIGQKPATLHTAAATINLPQRKGSDATHHPQQLSSNNKLSPPFSSSPISGTSTGRSLASLASGLSIQQPPLQQTQQQPAIHVGHNGRPTLRRRGSLESVMTETSANLQRTKLEDAVKQCGDYGKATADIVDMLLTLKRKERSLCLFNPDFLRDKVQLALEALATCNETDSEDEDDDEDKQVEDDDVDGLEMEYALRNRGIVGSTTDSSKYKPTSPHPFYPATSSSLQRNAIPSPPPMIQPTARESKAIPIVAPPKATSTSTISTHSLTKENLLNNHSNSDTTRKVAGPSSSSTSSAAATSGANKEVEALLISFEGKPIHEKKQLLGDKLFPLVKSTGTKQAPKVTIYLLDTVDLQELAHIMYDTQLLKSCVEGAFHSLQQQQ